jgi:hypothetical protein
MLGHGDFAAFAGGVERGLLLPLPEQVVFRDPVRYKLQKVLTVAAEGTYSGQVCTDRSGEAVGAAAAAAAAAATSSSSRNCKQQQQQQKWPYASWVVSKAAGPATATDSMAVLQTVLNASRMSRAASG